MKSFYELASTRRSIRKYEDRDIPIEEIEQLIQAAVTAPSGCNSQCWRFVVIKDKAVTAKIAEAVVQRMDELLSVVKDELTEQYLSSKRKMITFFINAPVIVAVFMTHLRYYDPTVIKAMKDRGYDYEGMMKFFACPDVLSVGAAIQNLLLAAHEKGYGACWMNEPAVAGEDINKLLGVPLENKFMSLIPIGYPAYAPRDKEQKSLADVLTVKV
jgi:nitroreductase